MKDDLGLSARAAHEAAARKDRVAKIVRWLDSLNETTHQLLTRIDTTFLWWQTWKGALGFWAKCPSDELRAAVRETIRARLPELYILTAEDRELLATLEAARTAACGEQWREPDMDTAEDALEDR